MTENENNMSGPSEDYLIEEDESIEEKRLEKLMEEEGEREAEFIRKVDDDDEKVNKLNMSDNKSPWDDIGANTAKPMGTPSTPSWLSQPSSSPWTTGSNFSGGLSGTSWGQQRWNDLQRQNSRNPMQDTQSKSLVGKKCVICDVFDCLYESCDSDGKPGKLPRAIFDIKPKFDVWFRISSLAPERVFIIFPPNNLIPAFSDPISSSVTLDYISQSFSTYLRIPRENCVILRTRLQNSNKDKCLDSAIQYYSNIGKKEDMVYVGVYSGRWGLSNIDISAANKCGLDYLDVANLIDGNYMIE